MANPYQFKPFPVDPFKSWDGSAEVLKAGPGALISMRVYNPNDEIIYIIVNDCATTGDIDEATNEVDCIPIPPGYTVPIEGSFASEFVNGITLSAWEAVDGTGALDANIMVSGRYQ